MHRMILLGLGLAVAATPAAAAERRYTVAGFDRVRAAGPFDVQVRVGPAPSVVASGPQRALDRLVVRSEGGQLVVRPEEGVDWNAWRSWFAPNERVVVQVTVPSLSAVALAGSGDVTVDRVRARGFTASLAGSGDVRVGAVEADTVELSIAGSGDITVAGRTRTVRSRVAGSGDIHADGLLSADANVSVAGSGNVALAASRTAEVSVLGSGDVQIAGRPRCQVTRRGSGSVRCGG